MKKEIKLKSVNDKDYLSVEEVSQFLGVKPNAIRNYLYLNYFTTYKFKTLTLIKRKEVIEWRKIHQ